MNKHRTVSAQYCASIYRNARIRQKLSVSWTAKRTNDWVLDKARVSRNLLESVKAKKLTYFGRIMRKKSES